METHNKVEDAQLLKAALGGALAMALAMGFGRFSYTPILPSMMSDLGLSASDAGLIASANFAGYLAGAVAATYNWASGRERQVAVSSLLATVLLLAAMPLFSDLVVFSVIRFLAGLASAFAMIFTTSLVMGLPGAAHRQQAVHFAGVGIGIAVSSLLVVLVRPLSGLFAAWQNEWLVMAAIGFVALLAVLALLPKQVKRTGSVVREPRLNWRLPLVLITASYGLFGFGYVITATFLVTIARSGDGGSLMEFASWFVTGIAAAVSLFVWRRLVLGRGLVTTYVIGVTVEAVGVLGTVALPDGVAPIFGGLLFGGTFVMITAFGLQIGRMEAPESPRKALAVMTAAFGTGQMVGPVVAGWIAERTGDFSAATIAAAAVLVLSALLAALLFLPSLRR
ncbi:YbfB/YjiJ family MFS transporter [Rhizobium sp. L1K21]|uniref:YbfB/YjiJ family MFS transporter n=1 Tax=Rhizobium sp. L1K21 TaxID=2954933 RepID=UPI0020938C97|nr:YbfB/YjiJ family MFS transporter [Rhizobium sp. L1K21]MCO6185135.1 MFS transporter [Rhizobium sp. L1K21]